MSIEIRNLSYATNREIIIVRLFDRNVTRNFCLIFLDIASLFCNLRFLHFVRLSAIFPSLRKGSSSNEYCANKYSFGSIFLELSAFYRVFCQCMRFVTSLPKMHLNIEIQYAKVRPGYVYLLSRKESFPVQRKEVRCLGRIQFRSQMKVKLFIFYVLVRTLPMDF